jgi:hypothetical protein
MIGSVEKGWTLLEKGFISLPFRLWILPVPSNAGQGSYIWGLDENVLKTFRSPANDGAWRAIYDRTLTLGSANGFSPNGGRYRLARGTVCVIYGSRSYSTNDLSASRLHLNIHGSGLHYYMILSDAPLWPMGLVSLSFANCNVRLLQIMKGMEIFQENHKNQKSSRWLGSLSTALNDSMIRWGWFGICFFLSE